MPQVSVVIPCYNYGSFLREALSSALQQDMEVEVIVVDDGSTDRETIAVLEEIRMSGVRVVRQDNRGLSSARNTGIRLTSGEYIVCLDSDDLLMPTYCSQCVSILNECSDVGFVYSTTRVFGDRVYLWSNRRFSSLHLLIDNYLPCSAMFRRIIWETTAGYAEDLRSGYEDWDFWLSAVELGWIGRHVEGELFWYRKHGQSMLTLSNSQRRQLKAELRRRHARLYSTHSIISLVRNEYWAIPRSVWALAKEGIGRPVVGKLGGLRRFL